MDEMKNNRQQALQTILETGLLTDILTTAAISVIVAENTRQTVSDTYLDDTKALLRQATFDAGMTDEQSRVWCEALVEQWFPKLGEVAVFLRKLSLAPAQLGEKLQ
ncbi:hypothetical protein [Brucella microti]|uniref:hypothetical protein n=1 Tax=Brucella microti TaxID=444163 RepID=UPI000304D09C|nr:hypothetical protein [Brucella microti]